MSAAATSITISPAGRCFTVRFDPPYPGHGARLFGDWQTAHSAATFLRMVTGWSIFDRTPPERRILSGAGAGLLDLKIGQLTE